jgi:hypothetical protein
MLSARSFGFLNIPPTEPSARSFLIMFTPRA